MITAENNIVSFIIIRQNSDRMVFQLVDKNKGTFLKPICSGFELDMCNSTFDINHFVIAVKMLLYWDQTVGVTTVAQ